MEKNFRLILIFVVVLQFFTPLEGEEPRRKNSEIVDVSDHITDEKAKFEMAKILGRHKRTFLEAVAIFKELLKDKPRDADLLLELSRSYIIQEQFTIAKYYLEFALETHPHNKDLLLEAAHAELGLGHPEKSYDLLQEALALGIAEETIRMDEASIYMLIGSFYDAEEIYKKAFFNRPKSLDLGLKLAWTYVSAQRYKEAEGLYHSLLICHNNNPKIFEALGVLKIFEKDFSAALEIFEDLTDLFPDNNKYLLLKADVYYLSEEYCDAIESYSKLILSPKQALQALLGIGKSYLKLGQNELADEYFQKAYDFDPKSIQAQFYQAFDEAICEDFIQSVIANENDPDNLMEWANVYAENGMAGMIRFYDAALRLDSDYFPAKIGLAEAFGTHYQYNDAINTYLSLLESFPDNVKVMMGIARVLSWGKRYRNSMQWYNDIIALNPDDPVPRVEKARVAYWGKYFCESMQLYRDLLNPPVDHLLLEACQEKEIEAPCLKQAVEMGSSYLGYEANLDQIDESLRAEFLPLYLLQKEMYLESTAKCWDWDNYYFHALPFYRKLWEDFPGNSEALYSYAQDYCSLGLCQCSSKIYTHMLTVNPSNDLVKMSLDRTFLRERPLLQGNYTFWTERGSGQFANSQIARHQFDQLYEWSPNCQQHIRFMQNEWLEYPFLTQKYYPAEGQTIEIDQVFNGYVRGVASATRKNYFHKFRSRYTCLATLWFNLCDYANLGIGFERKNEIYNFFNLRQGTQAKIYWTALKANTHAFGLLATYRHLDYNDSNNIDHAELLVSYAFTEDPTVFKVILGSSYRNAAHLTKFVINPNGQIVDVIFPYWTPDHYYSGSITLEYRYNYAWFTFCEAPQRYIDFKFTGEDDNAHNPSVQLAIDWKHEFWNDWSFSLTALAHASREWNAAGVWAQVGYRF